MPDALKTAAAWTGDVQVRNRGTTVGSVVHGDIAADQPAAVLALGGTIVVQRTLAVLVRSPPPTSSSMP